MSELFENFISLIIAIAVIAGYWKVYEKAGEKGWKAIIPVYNMLILLRIIHKPWWWIFFLFIPFVNIVFVAIIVHNLSKAFGKGGWFSVGLFFLPFIFVLILGLGSATYMFSDVVVQDLPQEDV